MLTKPYTTLQRRCCRSVHCHLAHYYEIMVDKIECTQHCNVAIVKEDGATATCNMQESLVKFGYMVANTDIYVRTERQASRHIYHNNPLL